MIIIRPNLPNKMVLSSASARQITAEVGPVKTDEYAAYGVRSLFPTYKGPAVRIKRLTDEAEADVWLDRDGTVTHVSQVVSEGGLHLFGPDLVHVFQKPTITNNRYPPIGATNWTADTTYVATHGYSTVVKGNQPHGDGTYRIWSIRTSGNLSNSTDSMFNQQDIYGYDWGSNGYSQNSDGTPMYVYIQVPRKLVVTHYDIRNTASVYRYTSPSKWNLHGSVDGSTWVEIDARSDYTEWSNLPIGGSNGVGETKTFFLSSFPEGYSYIRFTFLRNCWTSGTEFLWINEIALYGVETEMTVSSACTADVLVVGGGGGGGCDGGGGGGGGGIVSLSSVSVGAGSYDVSVGVGGAGSSSPGLSGTQGGSSVFSIWTAFGGGGGGSSSASATSGGSGGGGAISGSGTTGQGFSGGLGGGGGADGQGGNTNGGKGLMVSMSGKAVLYGWGGGSGEIQGVSESGIGDTVGGGVGGSGLAGQGVAGTDHIGGGGGGGSYGGGSGGDGGSGIVLVRIHPSYSGPQSLQTWLNGSDHIITVWYDQSGNNLRVTNFSGNPRLSSLPSGNYLYGSTTDSMTFPESVLPSNYTLFYVARYATSGAKRRIFQGTTATKQWFSGFDEGASGVSYIGGWATSSSDVHGNQMVVAAEQNNPLSFRSNGIVRTIANRGAVTGTFDNLAINPTRATTGKWVIGFQGASEHGNWVDVDETTNEVVVGGQYASSVGMFFGNIDNYKSGTVQLPKTSGWASFMVKYSSAGMPLWAVRMDGGGTDYTTRVKINKTTGSIYVCGIYFVSASLTLYHASGEVAATLVGRSDQGWSFMAKYDASGMLQWATRVYADNLSALAVEESTDHVYLGGRSHFAGGVVYNAPGSSQYADLRSSTGGSFMVKFDGSTGQGIWHARLIDGSGSGGRALGIDVNNADNSVYLTGTFNQGTTIYDGTGATFSETTTGLQRTGYLIKFDGSTGALAWKVKVDSSNDDCGKDVAVDDATGDVYWTGFYGMGGASVLNADGTTAFTVTGSGTASTNGTGGDSIFLVKYNSSGTAQWVAKVDGSGSGRSDATSVDVDGNGNVFIGGITKKGTVTFTDGLGSTTSILSLSGSGGSCGFVAKFTSQGEGLWRIRMDNSSNAEVPIISCGNACLFATGYNMQGWTITEPNTNTTAYTAPSTEIALMKFSLDGILENTSFSDGSSDWIVQEVTVYNKTLALSQIQSREAVMMKRYLKAVDKIAGNTSSPRAAYGMKLLFGAYDGPVFRVRRSSDSQLADVYVDDTGMVTRVEDVSLGAPYITSGARSQALQSWLNGSTAYVITLYDQSGNARHATQSDPNKQPISTSGSLDFRTSRYMDLPNGTVPTGSTYSFVAKVNSIDISQSTFGIVGGGNYQTDGEFNAVKFIGSRFVNTRSAASTDSVGASLQYPPAAMTSLTTTFSSSGVARNGSYTVTSSTTNEYPLYNLFDKNTTTRYRAGGFNNTTGIYTGTASLSGYVGLWTKLELPTPIALHMYQITSQGAPSEAPWRAPGTFYILGSNDDLNWTLVDSISGISDWTANMTKTFVVSPSETQPYKYFALSVYKIGNVGLTYWSGGNPTLDITEWRLYGVPHGIQTAFETTLAFTCNGTVQTSYANGFAVDSQPVTQTAVIGTTNNTLGVTNSIEYFNGDLSFLVMYDTALASTEAISTSGA